MMEKSMEEKTSFKKVNNKPFRFMKDFQTEVRKTRYRKIWLIILGMCAFHFIWTFWLLGKANTAYLKNGYSYLLFQLPFINAITLPLLIAMIASRICDIENKGNTLKLLYTLQNKGKVFKCKLLLGSIYILFIIVFQICLLWILNQIYHLGKVTPYNQILCYAISTFAVSFTILIIQQTLSLIFENQIAPLTFGLVGSFMGLFSMFFSNAVQRFIIWGYYNIFSTVTSDWNKDSKILKLYNIPFNTRNFIVFCAISLLIYFGGKLLFIRREV